MNTKTLYSLLAMFSGAMLALMIDINSQLAGQTSAFQASWMAHGIGAATAFLLLACQLWKKGKQLTGNSANFPRANQLPKPRKLYYLGGIPGAFTVVLASVAVQSQVGLAGTLALGLLGQLLFSLLAEHFGWFQLKPKTINLASILPVVCIASGASLIIYGRVLQ